MNHLDLFSGIGGFSLALKNIGIKHNWHGYSDIDKYANNIFRRHFNEAEELGGVESIQPGDLPRLDLITFGFPCQDLSIAGHRGGIRASRSGLFFEAMRIIRAKKPRYFIFENVQGLLSSNEGHDFIICLQEVANSGYDGQWELCNTRWFLPQNRERVFFVGHIRGERRPKVFPIQGKFKESKRELGREVSPCLQARDRWGIGNQPMGLAIESGNIRRLTPTEYSRLQGFPDHWTEGQSDSQRYRQLGNAISVPVVEEIFRKLYER
tara:strand:+ start:300 stop:1097 length:798 start_codon:yes stop_codon:yes gene_type:complete